MPIALSANYVLERNTGFTEVSVCVEIVYVVKRITVTSRSAEFSVYVGVTL